MIRLLVVILFTMSMAYVPPSPAGEMKVKLSDFRGNGGRLAWSPTGEFVVFDRRGKDGGFDLFITRDFTTDQCLTCNHPDLPNPKRNYGQPAIHPNGRYIVFQAEKQQHWPTLLPVITNPGSGVFNDLWLYDLATNRAKPLRELPNNKNYGTLHPQFSKDGSQLSWSELYGGADFKYPGKRAGAWKLKVATFSPEGLNDIKEFQPGEDVIYENHGFSHDGQWLFFSSNMKRSILGMDSTDIYKIHLQTGNLVRLTNKGYNEHAHLSPDGKYIVWMTSVGNGDTYDYYKVGADYWVMNADGSNKQRLTSLNNPDHPHFRGRYGVAADFDWDPSSSIENGYRFYGYLFEVVTKNFGIPVTDRSANGEYNFMVEFTVEQPEQGSDVSTLQSDPPRSPGPNDAPVPVAGGSTVIPELQEEPPVTGGSTHLPPVTTSTVSGEHCWKHVSYTASYTGKHSSGYGTGTVYHQVQPGIYKEKWNFDIHNPGKHSTGAIYQEHPGEIVIPGDTVCLGTEKMIKLDTLPSSRQVFCGNEPDLGGKYCVEGNGNEKHVFYLFEEDDIARLSSFSPGNIPTSTQKIAGVQALCFQTREHGNSITTCMHPEYTILMKFHLVEPDGTMMDLTATSFQVEEQADSIFTPDGPIIDPFEKSPKLKMMKQVLEETEAGQAGVGYDKLIDMIMDRNQAGPGTEQQREMMKKMLKDKLKNANIEDLLKEAGVELP